MPPVDEEEEHELDACPSCSSNQLTPLVVKEHKVMDLPQKPVQCTLHKTHHYRCEDCGKQVGGDSPKGTVRSPH